MRFTERRSMRLLTAGAVSCLIHAVLLVWISSVLFIFPRTGYAIIPNAPPVQAINSYRRILIDKILSELIPRSGMRDAVDIRVIKMANLDNDNEKRAEVSFSGNTYTVYLDERPAKYGTAAELYYLIGHELGHAYYDDISKWEFCTRGEKEVLQARADRFAIKLIGANRFVRYLQEQGYDEHEREDYFARINRLTVVLKNPAYFSSTCRP